MMLANISAREYVDWVAYFSVDWTTFKPDQSPDAIKNNLALSFPKKKRKK